ncbi:MAG: hypothetical protein FD123_745 [Bacteroidetes bacterium]|nr:MAG: hypothetical protein FD123_745 [Bacteroidota bacterium]
MLGFNTLQLGIESSSRKAAAHKIRFLIAIVGGLPDSSKNRQNNRNSPVSIQAVTCRLFIPFDAKEKQAY